MKLMIYPASKEVSSFARYSGQVKDFDEIVFVTEKGFANDGNDFMSLDGGELTGKTVHTDFEKRLGAVDAVFFAESPTKIPEKILVEKMRMALEAGKKVIVNSLPEELDSFSSSEQIVLLHGDTSIPIKRIKTAHPDIFIIPVPVIFVMGVGPNTNKLEVQVSLQKYLKDAGYSVSQVGSKKSSCFFGFDSLPDIFFQNTMTARDKIIALNRYFYKKYAQERPEVMIIGLPGGIMPLNPMKYEELGEMAFLISQAVTPDAAVLCVYAHDFSQKFFDELRMVCRYRLNSIVSLIVVSGTEIDISPEIRESIYSTVSSSFIQQNYLAKEFNGIKLFYALNASDMEQLGADLIDQLLNNL